MPKLKYYHATANPISGGHITEERFGLFHGEVVAPNLRSLRLGYLTNKIKEKAFSKTIGGAILGWDVRTLANRAIRTICLCHRLDARS